MTIAKAAIEKRERIDALREREPKPDLRAAVAELAHLLSLVCEIDAARHRHPEEVAIAKAMAARAIAVREALT